MERSPRDPPARPLDWPHYLETVLHFGDPVAWSVHVGRIAADGSSRLRSLGLDGPFAVVTAFHPYPERLGHGENVSRHASLRRAIEQRGRIAIPCAGSSADGSHREEGFAILCERDEAKDLAAEFGQAAIYWWDGESLWIDPVGTALPSERIAS